MKLRGVLFGTAGLALIAVLQVSAKPNTETLRGWLSDEQCAKGRAESGAFTPTNRDCAQKCVTKGKRIVLIDPVGKRVLVIANQDAAKANIGDYVEITGTVDSKAGTLHADSIKFLEKVDPMCEAPKRARPNSSFQNPCFTSSSIVKLLAAFAPVRASR